MELDNIVFEDCDNDATIAIKTLNLFVGTSDLKPKLKKLGVDYVKINRGVHVIYILTGRSIGRIEIKL